MESNYLKSARIKLERLGINDYKSFKNHYTEVFDIIESCILKEYARKMADYCESVHPTPNYRDFVNWPKPDDPQTERKPW